MKKVTLLGMLLMCAVVASANCGNGNGNGNGCSDDGGSVGPQGPTGPQGPQGLTGPQGPSGTQGSSGSNGKNGVDGKDGKNGSDANAQWTGTNVVGEVAVRVFDTKYAQGQVFDQYTFGSEPSQDIFGAGRNQAVGARLIFKLGPSYEESLLEAQTRKLKALEAKLAALRK